MTTSLNQEIPVYKHEPFTDFSLEENKRAF